MQVLKDDHQALVERFAKKNPFYRFQRALASNLRVHSSQWIVTIDQPQQSEQVGAGILERGIECHDSAVDLLAASAQVIVWPDPQIAAPKVDPRQVRRSLAVRD